MNRRSSSLAVAALAAAASAGCNGSESGALTGGDCKAASGNICTVAGTGVAGDGQDRKSALATNLYLPQDMTVAPDGRLYIADWNNHRIRRRETDGTLTIVAGTGELGLSADDPTTDRLNHPTNVTFDAQGNLVIAAWHNSRIKTVDVAACGSDFSTCPVVNMCGNGMRAFSGDGGPAAAAALNLPVAVVFNAAWDLIIADQANNRLRMVDHASGNISTIAGTDPCAPDATDCSLGDGGPATQAHFSFPAGQAAQPGGRIDIDAAGNIYVADTTNARVRKIDAAGIVTTIAGTGEVGYAGDGDLATLAKISNVSDVAAAPDGTVYVADTGNDCVRAVAPDGNITTVAGKCGQPGFAGDGGPAVAALLDRPTGLAVDPAGNLYVADSHNQRVRIVYK
jgi:sugar lactone lactonase YvrE